jgi:membrane associated rhomboid family serine protease
VVVRERAAQSWLAKPVEASQRVALVLVIVVLMWLATALNLVVLHGAWLIWGVRAHDPSGFWPNLLFAPFLHAGLPHLLANSVPFIVLGALIALQSTWRFALVTLIGVVIGAAVIWLLGAPRTVHIGASGLVFTYFGWLIARAIRERSILAIILGLLTLALFGSVLWGLSPFQLGISWQGHLGGLLAGVAAAWLWPARQQRSPVGRPLPRFSG